MLTSQIKFPIVSSPLAYTEEEPYPELVVISGEAFRYCRTARTFQSRSKDESSVQFARSQ